MELGKDLFPKKTILYLAKTFSFIFIFTLLTYSMAIAQVEDKEADPVSYLVENGARMIRENELEKLFSLIERLTPEKRGDFRIRVIENFANLKAYLISHKKEFGKKWQIDYKAICFTGNKIVTPILIDLLKDRDPYIRAFTARALAYLGDHRALGILKQVAETDPNSKVKSRAQWAYEHISEGKFPRVPPKEN